MFNWSALFRSRWAALIWAGGICWMAVGLVPEDASPQDQTNETASPADQAAQMRHLQQLVSKLEQQ